VSQRPRVLLADDHRIVAEGLKALLTPAFDLVGVVEDGRALLREVATHQPSVVVTDITMPQLSGLGALARLREEFPAVRVVILTMHQDLAYARRALELGASGYVLKHAAPDELVLAIRAALANRTFVTPELAGALIQAGSRDKRGAEDPAAALTPRQRDVLRLFAEGRTAKEIGAELSISARTVETHKYELMRALGIKSSAELIHFAIRHGIVAI
jgi:DNA-binding NarL/FixJ family response regulator